MRSWLAVSVACAGLLACDDEDFSNQVDADAGVVAGQGAVTPRAGHTAPARAGAGAPAPGVAGQSAGGAGAAAAEAGEPAPVPRAGSQAQTAGAGGATAGSEALAGSAAPSAGTGAELAGAGGTSPDPAAGSGGSYAAGSGGAYAAAGSGGAAGADSAAGSGGTPAPAPVGCAGPPGLYTGTTCTELASGVERFVPRFPLFTDDDAGNAAQKTRWIRLPAGGVIDTSNADRWSFPVGTIFFKEFVDPKSGKKVETRRMEKTRAGSGYDNWLVQSYAWSSDQQSVSVAPATGVLNALDTGFDIPRAQDCKDCHELWNQDDVDAPIGFNAIQLNHDKGGLDLASVLLRNMLRNERDPSHPNISLQNSVVPGTAVQQAGLGYLHGNCGHCHGGPTPHGNQLLWTPVGTNNLTDLPMFDSGQTGAVCHCLEFWKGRSNDNGPYRYRIEPSTADVSAVIGRMRAVGGSDDAMPPIGRKGRDNAGIQAVLAYINSLDGSACLANPPTCAP